MQNTRKDTGKDTRYSKCKPSRVKHAYQFLSHCALSRSDSNAPVRMRVQTSDEIRGLSKYGLLGPVADLAAVH